MVKGLLKAGLVSCDFHSWVLLGSGELDMSWWSRILSHCLFVGGFLASMFPVVSLVVFYGQFLPPRSLRSTVPIFSHCNDVSPQNLRTILNEATYPIEPLSNLDMSVSNYPSP